MLGSRSLDWVLLETLTIYVLALLRQRPFPDEKSEIMIPSWASATDVEDAMALTPSAWVATDDRWMHHSLLYSVVEEAHP